MLSGGGPAWSVVAWGLGGAVTEGTQAGCAGSQAGGEARMRAPGLLCSRSPCVQVAGFIMRVVGGTDSGVGSCGSYHGSAA